MAHCVSNILVRTSQHEPEGSRWSASARSELAGREAAGANSIRGGWTPALWWSCLQGGERRGEKWLVEQFGLNCQPAQTTTDIIDIISYFEVARLSW